MHPLPRRRSPGSDFSEPDMDIMMRQVSQRSEQESMQVCRLGSHGHRTSRTRTRTRTWRIPLWMRWKEFWAVLAIILAIMCTSIYNLASSDATLLSHLRESVAFLARTHAADLTRQIRTSVSALQALEGIISIDKYGTTLVKFERLAETLMRTYGGISGLALAPFGTLEVTHPLDPNDTALGHALLLDPARRESMVENILSRTTQVVGPMKLLKGGVEAIARRPIFSRYAPQYLPDEWFVAQGVNYTRVCSVPANRDEASCSYPGPQEPDGTPTFFWGFAILILNTADLVGVTNLVSLETGAEGAVPGIDAFAFELADMNPHFTVREFGGVWLRSSRTDALADAVEAVVAVEEFGFRWRLAVAPMDGWPAVSEDFWRQLLLILPATALMGAVLGVTIIMALRRQALRLEDLAKYLEKQRAEHIRSAVTNLNSFQFPMYLVQKEDLLKMGGLVQHEHARDRFRLRCFDRPEDVANVAASEGVVFFSHQWAGFSHPDPENVQYEAIIVALTELQKKGAKCGLIWVDYISIPQANAFLQQAAIDSLAVYASNCSVFVSVAPNCSHADSNMGLDMVTYFSRGWCRLELLSYRSGCGNQNRAAYSCDGYALSSIEDEGESHSCLKVVRGFFSCCAQKHPENRCDCEKIRGVLLGIYWRLLAIQRDGEGPAQAWANRMLELLAEDPEDYFPSFLRYRTKEGTERLELFQGYFPLLQNMFKEDSQLDAEDRLPVYGIDLGIPLEASRVPVSSAQLSPAAKSSCFEGLRPDRGLPQDV